MLYNPAQVVNGKPITDKEKNLAYKLSPFRLTRSEREKIFATIGIQARFLGPGEITRLIHCGLRYTDSEYPGEKNASQVWRMRSGECIEQNTLLYALFGSIHVRPKWLIVKNPKSYLYSKLKFQSFHPFLVFKYRGIRYRADAVNGTVSMFSESIPCVASQYYDMREMTAFHFAMSANRLFAGYYKIPEALEAIQTAIDIDPNNYAFYTEKGQILGSIRRFDEAEKAFQTAIYIAPQLTETNLAYADYVLQVHGPEKALKVYQAAVKKETTDVQVLHSLEKQLKKLGEKKAAKKTQKRKKRLKFAKRI